MSKIQRFRKLLSEAKINAYIVPSGDSHQNVAACDMRRGYISDFSGSAGTAVITDKEALLWTDGRYWLQANQQLDDNWTLMKQGEKDVADVKTWLSDNLPEKSRVGYFSEVIPAKDFRIYSEKFKSKEFELVGLDECLVDAVWEDTRPPKPSTPVFFLPLEYTGLSHAEKLSNIREKLSQQGAHAFVVSALDEIAWLLNLRGADIVYNPVFFAYVLITPTTLNLYMDKNKLTDEALASLDQVTLRPYDSFREDLRNLSSDLQNEAKHNVNASKKVLLDLNKSSVALLQCFSPNQILDANSPITAMKAVKNTTELTGLRNCHIRDAVAVSKFLCWLEDLALDEKRLSSYTEVTVSDHLAALRAKNKDFMGLSFETIAGMGPNGAIIHYNPDPANQYPMTSGMFLCDSGGQYKDGTTDITRTVHLGPNQPTEFEKMTFTRVLQGHIALGNAVFPPGTCGPKLDVLARRSLWEEGLDYSHGTGHGIGHFLNVHEGPHGISSSVADPIKLETALVENMAVTNEPGYYHTGAFGIRIENVLVVKKAETKHRFQDKQFLGFDTITKVPIQKKLIAVELLTKTEIRWLNAYHEDVLNTLQDFFTGHELNWLQNATAPLLPHNDSNIN